MKSVPQASLATMSSPEYECGKRNPLYPILPASIASIVNVYNLYNNDIVIYKIKNRVYLFVIEFV